MLSVQDLELQPQSQAAQGSAVLALLLGSKVCAWYVTGGKVWWGGMIRPVPEGIQKVTASVSALWHR